jgi:hypothetical protein
MKSEKKKLTILVCSPVYGIKELLDRVYTLLTSFGYDVWMSHKGTLPVRSTRNAFQNCLEAVKRCDLFLGIITPSYGSGQDKSDPGGRSITHMEMLEAIKQNKPRWILAHDHVVFARALLNELGFKGKNGRAKLMLSKNHILTDLRILDLYEEATIDHEGDDAVPLSDREGNWVQKFRSDSDGSRFVTAQFFRYQEVEEFIKENFDNTRDEPKRGDDA